MFRILVTGGRSFIVPKEDVVKGGKERVYSYSEGTMVEVELKPGKVPYEVTDTCGKYLETFADVNVLDKIKDEHVGVERKPKPRIRAQGSIQEQLEFAMAEIKRLSALVDKK